jgi:hypothetical protein
MALTQIGQDLAGGNGHRGEQIYRAEALVIVVIVPARPNA